MVVTFWGRPSRPTAKVWIHQCGSVDEALAARSAGADAVIAQGVEAGGHVRGTIPALELLARVRAAVGDGYPVLSAGGVAEATDVKARLEAGAEAVVCGTRFLMTEESGAHPDYKALLLTLRQSKRADVTLSDPAAAWVRPSTHSRGGLRGTHTPRARQRARTGGAPPR